MWEPSWFLTWELKQVIMENNFNHHPTTGSNHG